MIVVSFFFSDVNKQLGLLTILLKKMALKNAQVSLLSRSMSMIILSVFHGIVLWTRA